MSSKKDHVLCVTCQTKLPPEKEIHYFAQSALFPTENDLSFGDDIFFFLNDMAALFDIIGNQEGGELAEETISHLGKLGYEVAEEAKRRMHLLGKAHYAHSVQMEALRKRLGEEKSAA